MSRTIETIVATNIPNLILPLRSIINSDKDLLDKKNDFVATSGTPATNYSGKIASLISILNTATIQSSQTTVITFRNQLVTSLENLKASMDTFTSDTTPMPIKFNDLKSKFDDVESKYTSLSGALDVLQAASQSRPAYQTTNDKLDTIKTIIRSLYDNYFLDNKEVVSYLANITNIDGNEFSRVSKYIWNMQIPYQGSGDEREYLFFNNAAQEKSIYKRYKRLINTILLVSQTLNHIFNIEKNTSMPSSISITSGNNSGNTSVYEPYDYNANGTLKANSTAISYYKIDNNTLNIYYKLTENADDYVGGFSSPVTINTMRYDNGEVITENQILNNYIVFLMRGIKDYNRKKHIQAFYYYIYVLNECFKFYYNSERMIGVKSFDNHTCPSFNPADAQNFYLKKLYLITDYLNSISSVNTNTAIYTVKGKINNLCPIDILFTGDNSNYIHDYKISTDDYLAKVTKLQENNSDVDINKEYAIESLDYTQTTDKKNKLTGLTLKAGANIPNCSNLFLNDNTYSIIDRINNRTYMNNSNITIDFVKRSQDHLRKDYYEIGSKLQDLNTDIEKSRDKINAQVKNFDMQNSILKALDTRKNIYYVIFAIVMATILVLLLLDLQQSVKMYISLTIALILLIVNVINYYMKYDYIEQFTHIMEEFSQYMTESGITKQGTLSCPQMNEDDTFNTRVRFVSEKIPTISAEVVTIFRKLNEVIIKTDTNDMYSKLSSSLKNEKRNYEEQATKFKYKEDANKKSIDIMKHEMIEKTGYINLMSVTFLVIVLVYILYIIDPTFLNVYITIAIILILINMAVYYIVILHPVRTKARNKYWMHPSKSILQQTS